LRERWQLRKERSFGWAGLAFVVKAKRLESEERKGKIK